MRKIMKKFIFLVIVSASFTALLNPCQAATKEAIKAQMKRIDGEVTRIGREITAMKKQLHLLDSEQKRIEGILWNPKIYIINYQRKLHLTVSDEQLQELAATWAIHCLLWNINGPSCPSDPNKISVEYFYNFLIAYSQREKEQLASVLKYDIPEKRDKIKGDIAQQEAQKNRLTEEFLALEASLKDATSGPVGRSGIQINIGRKWIVREMAGSLSATGIWTRIGNTNKFDGEWTVSSTGEKKKSTMTFLGAYREPDGTRWVELHRSGHGKYRGKLNANDSHVSKGTADHFQPSWYWTADIKGN